MWLTQKLMAVLFDVTVPTVSEHLTNLFQQGEINAGATVRKFRIVQTEGTREVGRNVDFYNLDAIIAVGFRVNSARATQFNERDLLDYPGKVSAEVAKAFAESEFEKYRVIQDRLFESDFDRAIKKLPEKGDKP